MHYYIAYLSAFGFYESVLLLKELLFPFLGFDRSHGSLGLQHWSSISGQHRAVTESYISFHLIKILANHLKDKKLFNSFVGMFEFRD